MTPTYHATSVHVLACIQPVPHVLQSLPVRGFSWARFCCAAHTHRSRLVLCAGGPAGGNGGSGGNVWVQADDSLNSLTTFRKQVHYRADNGRPGGGSNMTGANAEDLVIKVSHEYHKIRTFCMRCIFAPVTSLTTCCCCCFCQLSSAGLYEVITERVGQHYLLFKCLQSYFAVAGLCFNA